ncbi:hypothetical protein E4633_18535 [Geomonas terrae]|uniref:Uncharacterized protein n=1 Tax=Geomonas terrae TaxID=2562681 RepID=A0A4S1CA72_9BACT|nr:hypothetical protein [Geomonas terrae]TGU70197.1 hypothetical protein E4633_18535 [Geomonas terrae]
MLRKVGIVSTLLLALPAFAHAWTVTAKIGSGQGSVVSGTKTISLPVAAPATGSIGYYKQDNVTGQTSQDFIVDPAAGYSISSVIVNGVDVTGTVAQDANGTYTVAAGSPIRNSQSLVVYFKQNLLTVTATQPAAGGRIVLQRCNASGVVFGSSSMYSLANLKAGAYVKVVALPNADYKAATVAGVAVTAAPGDVVSQVVQVNAAGALTATFTQVPVVKPNFSISTNIASPGDSVTVTPSAVSNMTGVTYTLTSDAPDETVTGTGPFTVKFPTSGTFGFTLTATVGGQSFPITKAGLITVQPHNACTTCHSNRNAVITTAWQTGAHGNASGHTTGTCQRCHATEGAIAGFAIGYTGGYADVLNAADAKAAYTVWSTVNSSNNGISCTVCHAQDPHNGGNNLRAVNTWANGAATTWDPNGNGKLDQYDVCTGCHSLTNNAGALVGNYHDGSSPSVERTISDSHFDDPTTAVVEGYNLRKAGATPCADCHNLHKADVEIQEEWAESGHAGKILAAKEAALVTNAALYYSAPAGTDVSTVLRPGSTRTYLEDYKRTNTNAANGTLSANALLKTIGPDTAEAFVHYNWTQTSGSGNRATCEKCHTATGAANYMNSPATYNPVNNDFSHISGWTSTAGANGKELLYCWGCHSDSATGALRNPGAVVADYKFQGAPAVYPNVGPSNTCLTCHVGQASGNSITDLTAAANTFTNVSFVNSHYMAAGSLMYVKGGYTNFVPANTQVAGTTGTGIVSYGQTLTSDADMTVDITGVATAGKLTSTHRKLGTPAINGDSHNKALFVPGFLDSDGPCVTCHYAKGDVTKGDNGVADHTLEFGAKTLNGVCVNCHGAEAADVAGLQNFIEEEGAAPFEATLSLALDLLQKKYNITYNQASYPYFFDASAANGAVKNWTRSNVSGFTALSAANAEKLMGACFNINLLKRDPAAFAHARTYARRLLYDTIDFLDDNTINQSVGTTALASGLTDSTGALLFVKDTAAYNSTGTAITTPYGTTTGGMLYILGWSRTTGAWAAYERP